MESLGVLAGGVAHDLNNMLGPMVGYPDLMLLKLAEDDPMRRHVKKIAESARQAASVVQDLLSLARRGRHEMEPTDMNDVVKSYSDSRSFLKLKEDHPEVDVKIELQEQLGKINGSASHLQKTVMNLVVNAFDAMPEGGELIVSTSEKFVSELASGYTNIKPGNYVLFQVRDSGMGIEPKDLERIFEPYFSKKTMGTSGTGLGLSVVYGVVKDHGGYYDILSTLGKGTEFILYFPIIYTEDELSSEDEQNYTGTETVLVVDDLEDQRDMTSELLVSLGYKTRMAANGREAVEYLRHNTVDIVVLDMIMEPGFDGLDTYREIIKLHPDMRVMVMSGYSVTNRVEEMKKLGGGQYLRKPFSLQEIGTAVRNELDKVMDARSV
jgi:CheY-like chemotaxis protein